MRVCGAERRHIVSSGAQTYGQEGAGGLTSKSRDGQS